MNPFDLVCSEYEGGFSAGTTSNWPVVDYDTFITRMKQYLEGPQVVIYIWKGPVENRYMFPEKLVPELHFSSLVLNDRVAYLMAGFGIVAGKQAYDLLVQLGVELEWSDEYIPLEEQRDYHLIRDNLIWEVK